MFTVDQVINEYYPALNDRKIVSSIIKPILRRLLHESSFIEFAEKYPHLQGIEFVEQILESFGFSYAVSDRERENIPSEGKVMIIANHPIGTLDGLALLKLVHEIRSDVRIVASDLLMSIAPLRPCLLPVKLSTKPVPRRDIFRISEALENEEAIITFPSGQVSRLGPRGIRDGRWHAGFLQISEQAKAPILPIHIKGRNSASFYLASFVMRPLSTLLLVGQMFYQQEKEIKMTIGSIIPFESYRNVDIRRTDKVKLFRKHVYRVGANKKLLFSTETAIARPERKPELKKAVTAAAKLGRTPDGKTIYLLEPSQSSPVMREIGRLREHAFRAVGEGTGNRRDLDHFDWYYQHLLLWDEDDLEIAGAYRFVNAGKVVAEKGPEGLYSASLFTLDTGKCWFLQNGLELGRSFVQQRYWGRRSLDYLWYGIGAFLKENPHYRYLFGPVSISNAVPEMAREILVYFYKLYFSADTSISCSRNPFSFSQSLSDLAQLFDGNDYKADFTKLKTLLSNLGTAVPPLYKQYTELCEPGGVVFLDFNIDPAFKDCVDGLVIVDTTRLKAAKRERYVQSTFLSNE
ncbi:MAG TPA: GNAT family N-acetyltransferase [Desulfofustis sp.]|jgi:putative hemolysin|nr:lysophospholipid acyltransferase family protein [Desulfofustis sp. PB-SRB1]HBH27826.1 GNAT family N-acetyltransferase [Desulfofustis sp.]